MRFLHRVLERARASSLDTGIKCWRGHAHQVLTKHYQLHTTTPNLTMSGLYAFKAAECFPCCSTSVSPTVSVVEAKTMCSNFMWDKGRAECSCVAHAHPLSRG